MPLFVPYSVSFPPPLSLSPLPPSIPILSPSLSPLLPSFSLYSQPVLPTGEEECKKLEDVFTEFSKQLRGLKGLPLPITSVQGASSEFRHTAVFHAEAQSATKTPRKMLAKPSDIVQSDCLYPSCDSATPPFVKALEGMHSIVLVHIYVMHMFPLCIYIRTRFDKYHNTLTPITVLLVVVQLENSSKWPDEPEAISHMKVAFYGAIGGALFKQHNLSSCASIHYLDVHKVYTYH